MQFNNITNIKEIVVLKDNRSLTAFELTLESGAKLLTNIDSLQRVHDALDDYYYKQDITSFFENKIEDGIMTSVVMLDTDFINEILESYRSYRDEANGGEYEDSRHWSECLDEALNDNPYALPNAVYNKDLYEYVVPKITARYGESTESEIKKIRCFIKELIDYVTEEEETEIESFDPESVTDGNYDEYIDELLESWENF